MVRDFMLMIISIYIIADSLVRIMQSSELWIIGTLGGCLCFVMSFGSVMIRQSRINNSKKEFQKSSTELWKNQENVKG